MINVFNAMIQNIQKTLRDEEVIRSVLDDIIEKEAQRLIELADEYRENGDNESFVNTLDQAIISLPMLSTFKLIKAEVLIDLGENEKGILELEEIINDYSIEESIRNDALELLKNNASK